ncbi:MAG: hypothetical protein RQ761_03730 [Bacteroidales bacterium]|nr:hypothetical protein [Bacteroidales bacterium]
MTEPINNPQGNKIKLIQLIVPILLSIMVFLLGIIAWLGQTAYIESRKNESVQHEINKEVLEKLSTINSSCVFNSVDVKDLKINDRRQDLILQEHSVKLNFLDK